MTTLYSAPNPLGFSVYLSSFEAQQAFLSKVIHKGTPVFTSLHISEEYTGNYMEKAAQMCHWLAGLGASVVADIFPKVMAAFAEENVVSLAKKLGVQALRLDYGFTARQVRQIAGEFPVVLNASTVEKDFLRILLPQEAQALSAMHNFYPRPETGLDNALLKSRQENFAEFELSTSAFIPGDLERRGPLQEGLPTLEAHRNISPLATYADLKLNFGIGQVYLGDLNATQRELGWISSFAETGILPLPVFLEDKYQTLFGKTFTCRPDSPAGIIRFAESREYSCAGPAIQPENNLERSPGTITIDNLLYKRYSGEIQLLRQHYPADARVNVIGSVPAQWQLLCHCVRRGSPFQLVPANS